MSKRPGEPPSKRPRKRARLDDDENKIYSSGTTSNQNPQDVDAMDIDNIPQLPPPPPPPARKPVVLTIDDSDSEAATQSIADSDDDNDDKHRENMMSYVLALCLPGTFQLPLLRLLLLDRLKKDDRLLVRLFYEARLITHERGYFLPYFPIHHAVSFIRPFRTTLGLRHVKKDCEDSLGRRDKANEAQMGEFKEAQQLQLAFMKEAAGDNSPLYGTVLGLVTTFSADIPIGDADRPDFIDSVMDILSHGILLTPKASIKEEISLDSCMGNDNCEMEKTIREIVEGSNELLLHLCAELVAYIMRYATEATMQDNMIIYLLCDVIAKLGNHFATYLFCHQSSGGDEFLTEPGFRAFGFQGDYAQLRSLHTLRRAILAKLSAFEKKALDLQFKLHDFQRQLIVDMVIQELLPEKVVREKQAGIRGLLAYAAPGTGKTMVALVAAAFLDDLGFAPTRKTLLLIPATAQSSFINDAYFNFKEGFRPPIYNYDSKKFEYVLLSPVSVKQERIEVKKQDLTTIRFLLFEKTAVEDRIPYGLVHLDKVDAKKVGLARQMRSLLGQEWRVFVDESHEDTNRVNYAYIFVRHWLKKRHATFLLTGTALVKDYYDIMSQLRLLGYQASKDKWIPDWMDVERYKRIDENIPLDTLKQLVVAKMTTNRKVALKDFPFEQRKVDIAIMEEHGSVPCYRAIRRITKLALKAAASASKIEPGIYEVLEQPVKPPRSNTFYEKLDLALQWAYAKSTNKIKEIIDKPNVKEANAMRASNDPGDEDSDDDLETKEAKALSKLLFNEEDQKKLKDFIKSMAAVRSTRNYGVDLRVLSASQLEKLKGRITRTMNQVDDEDKKELLQFVRKGLDGVESYRPKKNARKTIGATVEEEEDPLSFVLDMAHAGLDHDVEIELARIYSMLKPSDVHEMPLRYVLVLDELREHLESDETNKAVLFAYDKDVMQSFLMWTLHSREYRLFRLKPEVQEKEEEDSDFDGDFIVVIDASLGFEERRKVEGYIKTNPRLRVILTTYDIASTGLNLQSANAVFRMQENPADAVYTQAQARVDRMGQFKRVSTFDCISKNTGEIVVQAERLLRRQRAEEFDRALAEMKNMNKGSPHDLTEEDCDALHAALLGEAKKPHQGAITVVDSDDSSSDPFVKKEAKPRVKEEKRPVLRLSLIDNDDEKLKKKPSAPPTNPDDGRRIFFDQLEAATQHLRSKMGNLANLEKYPWENMVKTIADIANYHKRQTMDETEKSLVENLRKLLLEAIRMVKTIIQLPDTFETLVNNLVYYV